MAWTASGLYAAVLNLNTAGVTGPPWTLNTNKFFVTNNSDTPVYAQASASAIYAVTNEVSGTGWAAGGVAASALATGATDIVLALGVTNGGGSGPTVITYSAGNISVASTTLASPGVYGGYFYWAAGATKYKIIGIYFGGTGYITTAGTFAVTWATNIATITCSTSS